MKSILKWAGGKHKCLSHIKPHLSYDKETLIELFVGGGSLFLNTNFKKYILVDINQDLISFYKKLQTDKHNFISECESYFQTKFNNKDFYYEARNEFNKARKEKLFLYLNRHCYNGLCRYNKKGNFNVPFGKYKKVYFPREEMEFFVNNKADKCEFIQSDFRKINIQQTSITYADPPYIELTKTANFSSYYGEKFSYQDHVDLAKLAEESENPFLISNHCTPETKELYENATEIVEYSLTRQISCKSRNKVPELLAIYK